ncbi:MAG: cell division protein FtsA [Prevotellaceae bacterium]|nr:cell division protein FtsA [Prevotellaceae bacterium]
MDTSPIIVAADIGNSKLTLIAAQKNNDGQLRILNMENSATPPNAVRNGIITNASTVSFKLSELIKKLENRINMKIMQFYVCYNGHSLRTVNVPVGRNLNHTEVTPELLEDMRLELLNAPTAERLILDVFPQEYLLDDKPVLSPVGISGNLIVGNYAVAMSIPALKENLDKNIFRGICDAIPCMGPLMVAQATLSEEERQMGCAVIDFGAGCTSVTIYKGGVMRHFAVIPFGGQHITRDIMALNVSETVAEQLKIQNGSAVAALLNEQLKDTPLPITNTAEQVASYADLARVIEARQSEIVQYVLEQIEQSGLADRLDAGILLTGGASRLLHLNRLVEDMSGMRVQYASHAGRLTPDSGAEYLKPSYALIVGLLCAADQHCCQELPKPPGTPIRHDTPPPQKDRKKILNRLKRVEQGFTNLFSEESQM